MALRAGASGARTLYGGRFSATLIPGHGVGPELARAVCQIFKAARAPVDFEQVDLPDNGMSDETHYQQVLQSIKRNKVALKGPFHTNIELYSPQSVNMRLRKDLDVFASVVKCHTLQGVDARHSNIDCVIVRENTEGEYNGLEHEVTPGVVECLKVITQKKSERVAKYAFDYAVKNGRSKVTCVHKANIMKQSDGLFLRTCGEVAKLYPSIKFESMIVDNTCMQMVASPGQFDVMVMPNLYGTVLGNICAGLVGGAGLVPGVNIGTEYAIFEPGARHTGSDIEGKGVANPTAFIFSSTLLLRHLNLHSHADLISKAVKRVIRQKRSLTPDVGGKASTEEFVNEIILEMHRKVLHHSLAPH